MKTILVVVMQVILASGILYGYYHFILRNKKFHQYNRFYLLASILISVLIPFINIPVYFAESEIQDSVVLQTLQTISTDGFENETTTTPLVAPEIYTGFGWSAVLCLLYGVVALVLLIRILISLRKITAIIRTYPGEELNGVRFINTVEPGTPYSFFRWLFWNRKIELRSEKGEQIFRHEIYHIQQKHSVDIVFMELLTVVFWINPFFHLMKKEVKAIHEFLADQFAAHKTEKWEYAELLLMQALNTQQQLVNPFFHNQIKRRIAMITNPQKTSHRYLRKLLVLPVAAIVVALFAFTYKKKQENNKAFEPGRPITIVIDAAHGGTDPGAISTDKKYSEAQISLEIAKQIQTLAKEFDVNVIMTREDDKFPGNAANKDEGLRKRAEIANKVRPDAFISIHVNGTGTGNQIGYSGIEAYVSDKREDIKGKSLASAMLRNLSDVYKTSPELKQRKEAGVYVLDHTGYPAVLLQCGYINNQQDLSFITDKDNQEKLAIAILKGIVAYANRGTGFTESTPLDTVPKIYAKTIFPPPAQHSPTAEQLQTWTNAKMYGVWIDEKRIDNSELLKYLPSDFALWYTSKLEKNAVNYGKHYYQIDLITNARYNQRYPRKWGSASEILLADTTHPLHPLIVIDGKEYPGLTISNLEKIVSANDIEFINVLKDKASVARYGERGKSGVIEIKTKKIAPPISGNNQSAGNANIIFEKVEIEPSFPGGEPAWKKILERTLNTSVPAQNNAPPGEYTVYIQFIVHTDGSVSDIKTLTNHGFGMEQEAKRIIENSPRWSPAIQNGRTVNAYKRQRVDFVVGKARE